MQAPKSLRRPSNWQDFETLCKKLWGEIWNCPEIKKNGRNGQSQNGVDIYGIPKGEVEYFGIQCKGKDEYIDKQFTEEEIIAEIEKAKSFNPALKKLYFATTALKDVKVETFVRNKNVENIKNNLFEVHLFSWEDIVELIDENRITHDWYLNSQKFKLNKEAKITFGNDSNLEECTSIFLKPLNKSVYRMGAKDSNSSNSIFDYSFDAKKYSSGLNIETYLNLSFFSVIIKLHNTGTDAIEDFKILLDFEGDIQEISETNECGSIALKAIHSKLHLDHRNKQVGIIPQKSVLVSDDTFYSDEIFIKPAHNTNEVIVKWRLLSKDFKNQGELFININIEIETVEKEVNVPNSYETPYAYGEIEDFIVPMSYLE
ncbi:MAG: hypothetical protein H6574_20640 [Lewinellaceae bacterium]|nr:hypothetical protein [Lewinellaceae bacterium]